MKKTLGLFASEHWEIVLNKVGIEFRSRLKPDCSRSFSGEPTRSEL